MTRARKVDLNQPEVVTEFRRLGCSVQVMSGVGEGFPDLIVGFEYLVNCPVNLLVEIKDGPKAKLTDRQTVWHREWKGQVCVVRNLEDVRRLVKSYQGE